MILYESLKSYFGKFFGATSTDEVFLGPIMTFPALLLAYADGIFDSKAREYLALLADSYVLYNNDILEETKTENADNLFNLLEGLITYLDEWENRFLSVLNEIAKMDKDIFSNIVDMMSQIAPISDKLSPVEANKIKSIKQITGL